jgi:tRNA(Arg) A34 adenosine deaminase TadA
MPLDLAYFMSQALSEAKKGFFKGEVPVGAVLVTTKGEILARAHNQPIALNDPTAHAEILVMRKAGVALGNYRLTDTILVVTIEPCLMCMGAVLHARIAQVVFGAADPKMGAAGSVYNLAIDERLNHRVEVTPGILENDCRELIQTFFQAHRRSK